MLVALIMAGGKGTRFWPASTQNKPKQFLSLTSDNTMIQETVRRLLPLINIENIFICTSSEYKELCLEQLPALPEKNIIIEPVGRNTAPCILLSTFYISQIYPNSTIVVLPSDAMIKNELEQVAVFKDAYEFISRKDGILTIGIKPTRPETGYGYIQFDSNTLISGTHEIKSVNSFKEKPSLEVAKEYLNNGHYLWNAGIFMFNEKYMKSQYHKFAKNTYQLLNSLPPITDLNYFNELKIKYPKCEAISVDFSIIEKTDKLYVVPADLGWDDVGSWLALERYLKKDVNQNCIRGNVEPVNSYNNVIYSTTKPVILLDANDMFVLDTDEIIIVGKRKSLSKVSKLNELKK